MRCRLEGVFKFRMKTMLLLTASGAKLSILGESAAASLA